jgi:hypothetical protein
MTRKIYTSAPPWKRPSMSCRVALRARVCSSAWAMSNCRYMPSPRAFANAGRITTPARVVLLAVSKPNS